MKFAQQSVFGLTALIAGLILGNSGVQAQDYPTKPVRVINPYGAGGPNDFLGRLINEKLQASLGQPFITENRVAPSGNIGTAAVARSAPAGYTLVMNVDFTLGTNPVLYQNTGFDPLKDLAPISLVAKSKSVLVVHPSIGVNTVQELIALAKVKPLSFASGSNGTPGHLSGELFKQVTGIDMLHVPYKGNPPAVAATVAGEVQVFIAALSTILPHIKSGRVKALLMANVNRDVTLPDLPTAAEAGVPGIEVDSWDALAAPARTPPEVIATLNAEIVRHLGSESMKEQLERQGVEARGTTPAELAAFIRAELAKWGKVVRDSGAKAE